VLDAHVVRVLETGDAHGADRYAPTFQRLELQLDGASFAARSSWWMGRRRALDPGGFLRAGDRVLVTESRTGQQRSYAIEEIVRLPGSSVRVAPVRGAGRPSRGSRDSPPLRRPGIEHRGVLALDRARAPTGRRSVAGDPGRRGRSDGVGRRRAWAELEEHRALLGTYVGLAIVALIGLMVSRRSA